MSRASLAYPIAVGLAEGGWLTVLYLLVDAVARVHPPLGLAVFAVSAAVNAPTVRSPWNGRVRRRRASRSSWRSSWRIARACWPASSPRSRT